MTFNCTLFMIFSTYIISSFFFFNDTATTEIYTLSLHDALPISSSPAVREVAVESLWNLWLQAAGKDAFRLAQRANLQIDRKSTRLNSSHLVISYSVFCF